MYAIYRDEGETKPFALCLYRASTGERSKELHRNFSVEDVRTFLAERSRVRLENLGRDDRDPPDLVEIWSRPDR